MSPEASDVRDAVTSLIRASAPSARASDDFDSIATESLLSSGFLTIGLAEELGGSGGDLEMAVAVATAVGRSGRAIPAAELLHASWICDQAGAAWPGGLTTPADGSDLELVESKGQVRAAGDLRRVRWGRHADHVIAHSQLRGEPVVVILEAQGHSGATGESIAGEAVDLLSIDGAPAVAHPVTSTLAKGAVLHAALLRAGLLSGAVDAVLQITLEFTAQRQQFGKPLNRFQAVAQQLSEMAGHSMVSAMAVAGASGQVDLHGLDVAAAKAVTSRSALEVAALGHQLHGAMGLTMEYRLQAYTKRIHDWAWEDGSFDDWSTWAAHLVSSHAETPIWDLVTGILPRAQENSCS